MSARGALRRLAGWLLVLGLILPPLQAAAADANANGLRQGGDSIDRSTPRRTLRQFMQAARVGNVEEAARYLDLRGLPPDLRREAPQLARSLQFVIDRKLWLDWETVSDDPAGNPADGDLIDVVGRIPLGDRDVAVALVRQGARWSIAGETVRAVPALWEAYGTPPFVDSLPEFFTQWRFFELAAWQWLGFALSILLAGLAGVAIGSGLLFVGDRITRRTPGKWDGELLRVSRKPIRLLVALAAFYLLVDGLRFPAPAQAAVDLASRVVLVVAVAWFCVRFVGFLATTLEAALTIEGTDEGKARSVRTQVAVLRRVALALVWLLAGSALLLQFQVVRTVGMSLLASAGLAGVALGLAAQKSLTTLFAGIQLSFTQPIRIGDQVIVEGDWGTVEEIHLTYVVVRVWDLRRIVLPITYFLEKPFQNWTKRTPDIMGTVEIQADFTLPVEAMRQELQRICEEAAEWDKQVCVLQVTQMSDRTMTLRALVSAKDAGTCWALRCLVREKLIGWLQQHDGGRHLPRARYEPPEQREAANVAIDAMLR